MTSTARLRALAAGGEQLVAGADDGGAHVVDLAAELARDLLGRGGEEQDVARGIGVQLAAAVEIEVRLRDGELVGVEHGARFIDAPGVERAVVVGADVGVFGRGVAAAVEGEAALDVGDDAAGGGAVARLAGDGGGAREGGQERRLIGGALLEVRDDPALVGRVGVEAAAELIVDAAADERRRASAGRPRRSMAEQQVEQRRAWALGRRLEAAMVMIAGGGDGGERLVDGGDGRRWKGRQRRGGGIAEQLEERAAVEVRDDRARAARGRRLDDGDERPAGRSAAAGEALQRDVEIGALVAVDAHERVAAARAARTSGSSSSSSNACAACEKRLVTTRS